MILDHSDAFDFASDHVTWLQELGGLHANPHSLWRAGREQVA